MADSVKSKPKEGWLGQAGAGPTRSGKTSLAEGCKPARPLSLRRLAIWWAWVGTLALHTASTSIQAQSLLLGPPVRRVKPKIELDPRLPSGYPRYASLAAQWPSERACSPTLPICVAVSSTNRNVGSARSVRGNASNRSRAAVAPSQLELQGSQALEALESAYRRLVYAARLPAPVRAWDPDFGSPALTWELVSGAGALSVELSPHIGSAFDSAAVLCRSGVADGDPRQLERDAFLCVGEAIAARLDAAESPRSRRAYAETLWWELGQPGVADISAISLANAHANRATVGREDIEQATSTALLFEYLERSLGTATSLGLVTGLFALSSQPRRPGLGRVSNEPDWLDVLRASLGDDRTEFAHRMNEFAAARALVGRSDGPLGSLAWVANFARIVPDWELRVSSLPRRVASRNPVAPLGLVAVRVDVDVPTKDLSLAFQVEWEGPVPFTWTIVKLDAAGSEMGRIDFAFEPRVTNAEKRIVALEGVRSLLVLGVNLGGIDATHLLDPDHAPFEPHGCTLYVVRI